MASTNPFWAGRFSLPDHIASAAAEPPNLARHKLDRLRELRAVIVSLQQERGSRDPLYAWIIERERAESRLHD